MFTHTRTALIGLLALFLPIASATADDPPLPTAAGAAAIQPAFVGTNLKQETITAQCQKFTSDGSYWVCGGYGSVSNATKVLVVTSLNCRAYAYGTLTRTQLEVVQGINSSWGNRLTFPMTTSLVFDNLIYQSLATTLEYVVPSGRKLRIEGHLTGVGLSSANLSCTYTGRFLTP